jgi:protein involved in polysaccharide export with SLBB domain
VIAGEGGAAPDLSLREGERILVPPLGGAVAVGGEVTRPGIYELPAGAASAPLSAVLALAGQPLRPAGNRFVLDTTDGAGRRSLHEIGPRDALRRGDALRVEPGTDVSAGRVRLAGHVAAPLTRAAAGGRAGSLRALLSDPRLVRPDPYPRLGVVWRTDARTRARRFLPFDLARVLRGGADLPLAEGDEVVLLGQADVLWLSSPGVQQALRGDIGGGAAADAVQSAQAIGAGAAGAPQALAAPQNAGAGADCPALAALAVAAQASRGRFAHARSGGFPDIGRLPCPPVFIEYPALLPFVLDQAVLLTGEVGLPGLYPVTSDTGLDAVLAAAGGAADTADLSTVELSREPADNTGTLPLTRLALDLRSRNFAAVRLSPRDAVRLPRGFADRDTGPITLSGEFLRPGSYDIRRGERLSEVIARAGGLTPQAYPYGAVFSRESVRARQQEGFQRSARELEQGLMQVAAGQAVAGVRNGGGTDLGGAIAAGRELANSLRGARRRAHGGGGQPGAARRAPGAGRAAGAGRPDRGAEAPERGDGGGLGAQPRQPAIRHRLARRRLRARGRRRAALRRPGPRLRGAAQRPVHAGGPGRVADGRAAGAAGQPGGGAAGPFALRELGLPARRDAGALADRALHRGAGRDRADRLGPLKPRSPRAETLGRQRV